MARPFCTLLGIVLIGVGLWGVVTGAHAHELLVFGVNGSHNLVHLISGVLAIAAAWAGAGAARTFCLAFGAIYGVVAVAGFTNISSVVGLLNLNRADDLLHAAIAAACLAVGSMKEPGA